MCNLSHFKSDLDEFCLIALKLGTKLQEQHTTFEVVLLVTAEAIKQNSSKSDLE